LSTSSPSVPGPEHPGLLHHGGRLREAAARYGIALAQWLDVSTGINPDGWPVPSVPASAWARLPESDDALDAAARAYYGVKHLLPVAGSQAAIQALPQLRPPSRVQVLHPGYAEHAHAWRSAGHTVQGVNPERINQTIAQADVVVLIHPNNPTGACFPVAQLLHWHGQLARRGGWLIVDEAFMDTTPEHSLASDSERPGLIVLRSLGKFFGLAGARVGFVCAHADLLQRLNAVLGPWAISSPARWVATAALHDTTWQRLARQRLITRGKRLHTLLTRHGLTPNGGCALFQWMLTPQASALHEKLASVGILTRLFHDPLSLRFGLPACEAHWQRLDMALQQVTGTVTANTGSTNKDRSDQCTPDRRIANP